MKTLAINGITEIDPVAEEFIRLIRGHRKFAFYGSMGSGKTTLIKAVCKALGANDIITSPSFALINEYHSDCEDIFYHFDLYRIKSIDEVYDLGYEEYFFSDAYCFVEWAEKAEMLLPLDVVRVRMEVSQDHKRLVHVDV